MLEINPDRLVIIKIDERESQIRKVKKPKLPQCPLKKTYLKYKEID